MVVPSERVQMFSLQSDDNALHGQLFFVRSLPYRRRPSAGPGPIPRHLVSLAPVTEGPLRSGDRLGSIKEKRCGRNQSLLIGTFEQATPMICSIIAACVISADADLEVNMSNRALDLLIECELLKSDGRAINLQPIPSDELSRRYSAFVNARQSDVHGEIEDYAADSKLNAQFSTWSAKFSKEKALSSLLTYNRIVLNDPLVSNDAGISLNDLLEGIAFYSWLFPLIRAGLVSVYPINYYDRPTKEIPMLSSEDAFRSSISPAIHDFAHSNVILKSAVMGDEGQMFILKEEAGVKRRTALSVSFTNDTLYSGVGLFKFTTMSNLKAEGDEISFDQSWEKDGVVPEEKFNQWAYQATNQAIIARLKAIANQVRLAENLGHTYITESAFESTLLSLSNTSNAQSISPCVKFLEINSSSQTLASPETIIELRDRYSTAFERFNLSLLSVSEELSGIEATEFHRKSLALYEREIMPQIDEVRGAIGQIGSGVVKGVLASFCGVGLAIGTGTEISLVPALLASISSGLTETLPAVRQLQSMKKRPAYIWHRLAKA